MKPGDDISAVIGGAVRHVVAYRHSKHFVAGLPPMLRKTLHEAMRRPIVLTPENEGIEWARGHSGPQVDALRVVVALGARLG